MPSSLLSPFPELDTLYSTEFLSHEPSVNINLKPCMRQNQTFSCPSNLSKNTMSYEQLVDLPLCLLKNQNIEILPSGSLRHVPFQAERSVSMIEGSTNMSGVSRPPSSRYKTELCRTFHESRTCKYGSKCQFAHGTEELRGLNRHPKYKTELCRTYHTVGFCPYGSRCHFIHNSEEQRFWSGNKRPVPHNMKPSFSCSGIPFLSTSSNSLFSSVSSLSSFSPSTVTPSFLSNPFQSTKFCSSPMTPAMFQSMIPPYPIVQSLGGGILLHLTPSPAEDPVVADTWDGLSQEDNGLGWELDSESSGGNPPEAKRLPIFSQLSD